GGGLIFTINTTADTSGNGSIRMDSAATVTVGGGGAIILNSTSNSGGSGTISQQDTISTTPTLLAATVTLSALGTGSGSNFISVGTNNPSGTVDLRARSTGDNVTVDNQGFVNLTSTNTA